MSLTLKVSDVWKDYNGVPVLKGCSFSMDKAGVYILTGTNGSGKSTFLRICGLLEYPDRGVIDYSSGQKTLEKDIELKRKITLVLPRVGVFNTSVFNNAAYGLKIRGMAKNLIEERVNTQLESLGLLNKKNNNAFTLSSGEIQRLGIARAMVTEPAVLFLDEPTASVDRKNSGIIEGIILKMKEAGRPALVMTTHDMAQANRLADNLMVIEDGRILTVVDKL